MKRWYATRSKKQELVSRLNEIQKPFINENQGMIVNVDLIDQDYLIVWYEIKTPAEININISTTQVTQ